MSDNQINGPAEAIAIVLAIPLAFLMILVFGILSLFGVGPFADKPKPAPEPTEERHGIRLPFTIELHKPEVR